MLDIAWPELVVIGAVALVAIGPKDLPKVMHNLGCWVGKARSVAQEFHSAMDRLSYEAEVAEKLRKAEAEKNAAAPAAETTTAEVKTEHDRTAS